MYNFALVELLSMFNFYRMKRHANSIIFKVILGNMSLTMHQSHDAISSDLFIFDTNILALTKLKI